MGSMTTAATASRNCALYSHEAAGALASLEFGMRTSLCSKAHAMNLLLTPVNSQLSRQRVRDRILGKPQI